MAPCHMNFSHSLKTTKIEFTFTQQNVKLILCILLQIWTGKDIIYAD
ncbi:hypothetical protein BN3456_02310 [Clostridium sp. C105KSO13]|nr:hypothetical protein BN3456_02310 [Clostridium sp. C105KSO13]